MARGRDHGGLIVIDLRDRSGIVQLTVDPSHAPEAHALAEQVRSEYVLAVGGVVLARSPETVNPNLPTGEVEVRIATLEILNRATTPPFEIESAEQVDVDETLRLRYRYLDLRRAPMLANLELRNAAVQAARAYLNANRFIEVETPYLTRSSPEGARDFLVPSRLQPHRFYALPQSPQMFKQILMLAGMDRYYQFARCFRDEDLRADRQPEHTQIDIETAFLTVPEIRGLLEGLMSAIFEGVGETPPATPLPRLSYDEAMRRYGTDKPDLRYGLEIVELSDTFAASGFKVFRAAVDGGGVVRAVRAPGGASLSRAQIDRLTELAREHGAKGMAYWWFKSGWPFYGLDSTNPNAIALWKRIGVIGNYIKAAQPLLVPLLAGLLAFLGCSGPAPGLDPIITFEFPGDTTLPNIDAGTLLLISADADVSSGDQVTDVQWTEVPQPGGDTIGLFATPTSLETTWVVVEPASIVVPTPVTLLLEVETLNGGETVTPINLIVNPAVPEP